MNVGDTFGPSSWIDIPQEKIDAFAEATGDHQWIHVDPERAKDGPFGMTIGHGYLTLSLLPVASYERKKDSPGKVSDCSNGYRAVRTSVLPQLVLRQEQFHTSEFLIEAIKRGIPAEEVPVTVVKRLHGHSKKPAVVRYGLGFANAIMRTWLR